MISKSEEQKITFIPFNAINEFMLDDYRRQVISEVLESRRQDGDAKSTLDKVIKQAVFVPGFRNPVSAPVTLLTNPLITAFEKKPKVTATVLQIWAKAHTDLAVQVGDLLKSDHWEIFPIDTDHLKLPGFYPSWPDDSNFDTIFNEFRERYPDSTVIQNDVALMTVWLSNRLPFNLNNPED